MIGFDHFVLYDSKSQDSGAGLLLQSPYKSKITLVEWHQENAQPSAFQHYIDNFRYKFEWTCFIDVNEFLHVLDGSSIFNLLGYYNGFSGVLLNWLVFGPAMHAADVASRLVLETCTKRLPGEAGANRFVRSMIRNADIIKPDVTPHTFRATGPVCNALGQELPNRPMQDRVCHERLVVNRYQVRPFASREFTNNDKRAVSLSQLVSTVGNTVLDPRMSQYVPALKSIVPYPMPLSARPLVPEVDREFAERVNSESLVSARTSPRPVHPSNQHADLPNPDLLARIPPHIEALLDIGCGTGALGAAYRQINGRAHLFGVESDPKAALIARDHLDDVAVADVETYALPRNWPAAFDCIVYGDVLQQLQDPWMVLRRQLGALRPSGTVLVCVPNLEHWSVAARLLRGNWGYEPSGLFDSAHLRWFTLRSLLSGISAAGLKIQEVHPRVFDQDRAISFANLFGPALRALGVEPADYARRASPLQYVIRATKEE